MLFVDILPIIVVFYVSLYNCKIFDISMFNTLSIPPKHKNICLINGEYFIKKF